MWGGGGGGGGGGRVQILFLQHVMLRMFLEAGTLYFLSFFSSIRKKNLYGMKWCRQGGEEGT